MPASLRNEGCATRAAIDPLLANCAPAYVPRACKIAVSDPAGGGLRDNREFPPGTGDLGKRSSDLRGDARSVVEIVRSEHGISGDRRFRSQRRSGRRPSLAAQREAAATPDDMPVGTLQSRSPRARPITCRRILTVVADRHGGASRSHRGCFVKGAPARVWRGFRHVGELRARTADLAQII
jgi:hypothetical protein